MKNGLYLKQLEAKTSQSVICFYLFLTLSHQQVFLLTLTIY